MPSAAEPAPAPLPPSARARIVAVASTAFVLALIGANFSVLQWSAPARFIGFDQKWMMFTRPPHKPSELAIFAEFDGKPRPIAPPNEMDFRWRRYLDSMRGSGTLTEWRCLALIAGKGQFSDRPRRISFAVPVDEGRFRRIYSVTLTPIGTDSALPVCGSTDQLSAESFKGRRSSNAGADPVTPETTTSVPG